MAKTIRNGNVVIRVSDIVAVHIPAIEPFVVEICTRYPLSPLRFTCSSREEAIQYLNDLQKEIENE